MGQSQAIEKDMYTPSYFQILSLVFWLRLLHLSISGVGGKSHFNDRFYYFGAVDCICCHHAKTPGMGWSVIF